ncbi:hypothetical protein ETD83_04490 [Actinomadura soli]|uniref:Uncharacterized protein n=1 Tax=Actinomadura soli TaxID=2508997 RepID=A0A5C4JJ74_9ACTN|nr:hypothetical protein ETD83_04490 [Actinomadura soli]
MAAGPGRRPLHTRSCPPCRAPFSDVRPAGFRWAVRGGFLALDASRVVNRDMSKKTRKRRARKRSKSNKGKRPNARR